MRRSTNAGTGLVLLALTACMGLPELPEPSEGRAGIVSGTTDTGDPSVPLLLLGGGECTGTLIAPHTVLTAHHCTVMLSSGINVFFGNEMGGTGTTIAASAVQRNSETDLALVLLSSAATTPPLPINRTTLGPSHVGQAVRLVGFGTTAENAEDSGLKRQGTSSVFALDDDIMFVGASGSSTCYGDSGGPAFMTIDGVEVLAGVTSFGTDICDAGLSGEIRVDLYLDWIDEFIAEYDPPLCTSDGRCATGCTTPDPDCACAADGTCSAACPSYATADPDCAGCGSGDACREGCPALDTDCCGADGTCHDGCGAADADCAPATETPEPGGGGGSGGGGGGGEATTEEEQTGDEGGCGCRVPTGRGSPGNAFAVALLLLVALRHCRRRR